MIPHRTDAQFETLLRLIGDADMQALRFICEFQENSPDGAGPTVHLVADHLQCETIHAQGILVKLVCLGALHRENITE